MAKTSAAAADLAVDVPPAKGKKTLVLVILAALVLALVGVGALYMKQKAAAAAAAAADEYDDEMDRPAPVAERRGSSKAVPTFVTLEPFVVNLADRDVDRFAQIGVVLEVEDPQFAEEMKAYMPAIRNGILMVLSHKTSEQLLSREGKLALAAEIMRESVLPMGIRVRDEPAADDYDDGNRRARRSSFNPVRRVHFSNFIVQ